MVVSLKKHFATEKQDIELCSKRFLQEKVKAIEILETMADLVQFDKQSLFLEVGAAQGCFVAACNSLGHHCVGLEPFPRAIEMSKQLSKEINIGIEIKHGYAEELPFPSKSIDIIFAFSVMEHVKDVSLVLKEISRVLKPGGAFYFSTASALCPMQNEIRFFPFFSWYPQKMKEFIMKWALKNMPSIVGYTDAPAINWFTPWKTRKLLSNVGLNEIYDHWDLKNHDRKPFIKKNLLKIIKLNRSTKVIADIFYPGCSYLTIKKKLRILHVTLYVDIGGLEKLIFELGKYFVELGAEVEVLCLRDINLDYLANLESKQIPVHLLRKKSRLDVGYHYRVARFIKEKSFDVLHAHSGCFWDAALFSLLSGGKKFVYTAHGLPIEQGLKARAEDILAGFVVDDIVAVSDEIEQVIRECLIFNGKKISTIKNGIDTEVFLPLEGVEKQKLLKKYKLPEKNYRIGSVGRLASEKNYQMLLHAFAHLTGNCDKKIDLLLVGSGRMEKDLQRLVADLGIEDKVYFLGVQHKIYEILPLFDVFVLSSFTEGTSISLLEAQSCGVPAVVTDVGGNSFVVENGKSGMLCQVNDVLAMSACLKKFLEEPDFSAQCGKNARKRIEEVFSFKTMADKYAQLYLG